MLNGAEFRLRRSREAEVQRQLTAAAQAIAGPEVLRGQEVLLVERALARRDEETRPFRNALDPDGLEVRLVHALEEAMALDLEISRWTMSAAVLAVEGTAASLQAVEGFAARMRIQGWGVQADTPGSGPDGRVRFILKGTAGHEG